MTTSVASTPRCFISYARENQTHADWVLRLAEALSARKLGIRIDQLHCPIATDLPTFMEREVEAARHVLLVCTNEYMARWSGSGSGVAYEAALMKGELMHGLAATDKYIPLLRSGDVASAVPKPLRGSYYLDLRDESRLDDRIDELAQRLLSGTSSAELAAGESARSPIAVLIPRFPGPAFRENFDADDTDSNARESYRRLWCLGQEGHWYGQIRDGVYRMSNSTGPGEIRYSYLGFEAEAGAAPDAANHDVSVDVWIEPSAHDSYSGAGLLYRYNREQRTYMALVIAPDSQGTAQVALVSRDRNEHQFFRLAQLRQPPTKPISLRMMSFAGLIKVWVDGRPIGSYPPLNHITGDAGLITMSLGTFCFDNFAVLPAPLRLEDVR
ncbi:MAG: toll/interleukin-1 receptor domain-containing protein [Phycisphaerales bacterium]|nr:toll/interleukin-1 receptor domain-containing protein [Phycisphaerales bacterium]